MSQFCLYQLFVTKIYHSSLDLSFFSVFERNEIDPVVQQKRQNIKSQRHTFKNAPLQTTGKLNKSYEILLKKFKTLSISQNHDRMIGILQGDELSSI